MSFEDWVVSTRSKATGSWNLDTVLPEGLDFFILLSSLNGIIGGRARKLLARFLSWANLPGDSVFLYMGPDGLRAVKVSPRVTRTNFNLMRTGISKVCS